MQPYTAAFAAAIRDDHTVATSATICSQDGTVLVTLAPTGGSVTVDRSRDTRRECSLDLIDPTGELTFTDLDDLLAPTSGNELRLARGVTYPDGSTELIPLGVFRLTNPRLSEADGVRISVTGRDRTTVIQDNRWTRPFRDIYYGTLVEDAVAAIIADRYPTLPTRLASTGITTPTVYLGLDADNDPFADAVALAATAGHELYIDVDGAAVMAPLDGFYPGIPTATYRDGTDAALLTLDKEWATDGHHNGVIVTSEYSGSDSVLRIEIWDDNPASPTYYLGDYGRHPMFLPVANTAGLDGMYALGRARLAQELGVDELLTWTQLVNPAHDVGDYVTIVRDTIGVDTTVQLQSLTIPLAASEAMTAGARRAKLD